MNMQSPIAPALPFTIGHGFADNYGRSWIVAVEPVDTQGGLISRSTLIIGGPTPMAAILWNVVCVRESLTINQLDEHTAARRLAAAPIEPHPNPAGLYAEALAKRESDREQRVRDMAEADARKSAAAAMVEKLAPAGSVAAIVAELHEDDSDSMSDYHNHKTRRVVVIGWSSHKRDLFPELRKAAATFPETVELATADAEAEHREKYSMGAGFYLKQGWRDSSGWCVRKRPLSYLAESGLEFSDAVRGIGAPPSPVERPATAPVASGRFTIGEHTHTKKGWQFWIVELAERVERDEFDRLLGAAKALRGWYSRPWQGTPGGFAFKSEEAARAFMAAEGGDDTPPPVDSPTPPNGTDTRAPAAAPTGSSSTAAKLRAIADSMAPAIADKFRDRLSNTPKRALQAAHARNDGVQLERAQAIGRALADAHDAGTVPACLARVNSKAVLVELAKEEIDRSQHGYYDAGSLTGRPYQWREADKAERAAAAWELISTARNSERAAELELRAKLDSLRFAKIPGYFPTPAPLVARMIEAARLADGARVLEPSAGSGAIADALKAEGFAVECIEQHSSLCDILAAKGHNLIRGDFLQISPCGLYAGVVMNPPFEGGQDCEHVRHAWQFVEPGGSLVAIMGAGVTFRQDPRFASFRAWVDELGGELVDIPAGTFKESGTGVASVMLTLCKD